MWTNRPLLPVVVHVGRSRGPPLQPPRGDATDTRPPTVQHRPDVGATFQGSAAMGQGHSRFQRWLRDRVEVADGVKTPSVALYADYLAWGQNVRIPRHALLTRRAFGDALGDLNFLSAGRNAAGFTLRSGLRLRAPGEPNQRPCSTLVRRATAILVQVLGLRPRPAGATAQALGAARPDLHQGAPR